MSDARAGLTGADPADAPALGESRARVLAALQAADAPLGVGEVAARVRLHLNTARFHLDGLVQQGLAERITEQRETPGRPRALYSPGREVPPAGRRSYQLLAQILTSSLARGRHRERAALEAGQEWGRHLTERPASARGIGAAAATQHLVKTLDDIGFAPEATSVGRKRQIRLHHCPFREAAAQHPEVVCSIHLGLMRGVLAELDAPLNAERLEPFVEPHLCITHLETRQRSAS
jgi:predicted ArsR family transcriptional regulator